MKVDWTNALKLAQKCAALQAAQEIVGVNFDKEKALVLVEHIKEEMAKIEATTLPLLPPRPLKASEKAEFTMPKKAFKADGTFSALMEKFVAKHGGILDSEARTAQIFGKTYPVAGGVVLDVQMPMEISDNADIKEWLLKPQLTDRARENYTGIVWREV